MSTSSNCEASHISQVLRFSMLTGECEVFLASLCQPMCDGWHSSGIKHVKSPIMAKRSKAVKCC